MATRVDVIIECDYCGKTSDDVEERSVRVDKRIPQVADACGDCWASKSADIAEIMAPGRSKTIADREAAKIKKLVASLGARTRAAASARTGDTAAPADAVNGPAAKNTAAKKAAAKKTAVKKTAKKAVAKKA